MMCKNFEFVKYLQIKFVGEVVLNILVFIVVVELEFYLYCIQYIFFVEIQQYLFGVQLLLLFIDCIENVEFVLIGKFFEYLKFGWLVLLIGFFYGDVVYIIWECNVGFVCDFDDLEKMEVMLIDCFQKYFVGENMVEMCYVENFFFCFFVQQFVGLMDKFVSCG